MAVEHRQHGFTLIELLAATTICAILMIGVSGVIAAIGTPGGSPGSSSTNSLDNSPAQVDGTPDFNVLDLVGEQLQWDLAHARYGRFNHNTLTLYGYGSLDSETLEPIHRPTQVKYLFESSGDQSWLIREQRDYDSIVQDTSRRQLVLTGVQQILIQVLEEPLPVELAEMDDEQQVAAESQDLQEIEDDNLSEDQRDCKQEDCAAEAQDDENDKTEDEKVVDEEEDPDDEKQTIEIEWFDLKQKTGWFLMPDVVKFVFIPEDMEQVAVKYDGYDWMDKQLEDEVQYPQKVVILR